MLQNINFEWKQQQHKSVQQVQLLSPSFFHLLNFAALIFSVKAATPAAAHVQETKPVEAERFPSEEKERSPTRDRPCSSCNRAATELQNSFSDGSPTRKNYTKVWVHNLLHSQYMLRQSGRPIQNTTNSSSNNTANATSNTNTDAVVVAKLEIVCSGLNCPVDLSNPVAILVAVVVGVVVSAT
jgi:hypothetical protein